MISPVGEISGIQTEALMMAIWIVIVLSLAILSRGRVKGSSDFMVGGRAIPAWMLGMWSAGAAATAWALFGLPGAVYQSGMLLYWSTYVPTALGFPLAVLILGRWLRVPARKYSLMTLPDFLGEVYGGNWIRVLAAAAIVITCIFYATLQFRAIGIIFSALFGLNYAVAASLGITVAIIYVILGGFRAGAVIGTFNVSAIIVASLVAIVLGYTWTGGYGNMLSVLSAGSVGAQYLDMNSALGSYGWWFWVSWALLLSSFGLMGQPAVVQKLYGVRNPRTLWVWGLVAAIVFGLTGSAYCYLGEVAKYLTVTGQAPDIVKLFGSPDYVMAWLTMGKLSTEQPILGGLLILGIIGAAWCALDGFLLMGGSAIARDIIHKCFRPNWNDRQLLRSLRLCMLVVGALIVAETLLPADVINMVASIGWAQFAATLAPPMILAILWKGATRWGGIAGVIVGFVVSFSLTVVFRLPKSPLSPWGLGTEGFIRVFYLDAGTWGFIAGLLAIIIVSLLTHKGRGPLYSDMLTHHPCAEPASQGARP